MNATTPIEPGTALATYDVGVSLGCFHAVAGKTFWFLFKKADGGVTYAPNVPRYTEKDTKVLIERYADMPASPEFSLRNLYDLRETAVLVALEEGVVKQWIDGRTLLVGDSAHKVCHSSSLTPRWN